MYSSQIIYQKTTETNWHTFNDSDLVVQWVIVDYSY